MQIVNTELFKGAYAFTLTVKNMGNSRKGDIQKVEVDADKRRLRLGKQLLVSPEFDAIREYQRQTYNWCIARSNPSCFKKGFYLVKKEMVPQFEDVLREAQAKVRDELVPAFQRAYPGQVDEARIALNGQFREKDYPAVDQLPGLFGLDWNWVAFAVPDDLPEDLRKAEETKLQKKFEEAEVQIVAALREGFQTLVDHALDKLKTPPGEKPKQFKESLVTNIKDFIETFSARNLLNDRDLENLVEQARNVLTGVNPEDLDAGKARISESALNAREALAAKFEPIKTVLDGMIVNTPSRKFEFDED